MTTRADDRMYWAPVGVPVASSTSWEAPQYVHWCPTAVVTTIVRRDQLDWTAEGVCRYCKEPLP